MKEGIDTKYCDCVVFMDDRYSFNQLIQNIGRSMRKRASEDPSFVCVCIPALQDEDHEAMRQISEDGMSEREK